MAAVVETNGSDVNKHEQGDEKLFLFQYINK